VPNGVDLDLLNLSYDFSERFFSKRATSGCLFFPLRFKKVFYRLFTNGLAAPPYIELILALPADFLDAFHDFNFLVTAIAIWFNDEFYL
jgi:hypothetical protein